MKYFVKLAWSFNRTNSFFKRRQQFTEYLTADDSTNDCDTIERAKVIAKISDANCYVILSYIHVFFLEWLKFELLQTGSINLDQKVNKLAFRE